MQVKHRRRKAAGTKRRRRVHHAGPIRTQVKHRRRTHRRKKGMLSEMVSGSAATGTMKAILGGLVGAFVGTQVVKLLIPNEKPLTKGLLIAGLGFVTGTMLKQPSAAAGIVAAGLMPLIMPPAAMSENFLSQQEMEMLPAVLSENYLSESYLNEDSYSYLQGQLDR